MTTSVVQKEMDRYGTRRRQRKGQSKDKKRRSDRKEKSELQRIGIVPVFDSLFLRV